MERRILLCNHCCGVHWLHNQLVNSADPDETAPAGAVSSGSSLFTDRYIDVNSKRRIKRANSVAIQSLQTRIKMITIPDQSGSASGFDYTASNMRVTQFNLPSSSVDFVPGQGLAWKASDARTEVDGDWKYTNWIARDHGTFTATVSSIAFDIQVLISSDSTGRPQISTGACSASVGKVGIKIHGGGVPWLYNLFDKVIGNKIKDKLNSALCPMITNAVDVDAENKMKDLPMTIQFAKNFLLDYRLTTKPLFDATYMETYHKGEVFWKANLSAGAPMVASPMPKNGDTQNMVFLWVSDFVLDTFLYQAQMHGFLVRNVTSKDLPPSSRGVLNTTCTGLVPRCIGKIIKAIGEKYPNSTVELRINSTHVPDMAFTNSGVYANFSGTIDLYARVPNKAGTPFLVSLNATMSAKLNISVGNQKCYPYVSNVSLKLKSAKSDIGPINDEFLNVLIDKALKMFIIPKLNEAGKHGFPLPVTKEITFVNTKLTFAKDALEVSTDLKYTPADRTVDQTDVGVSLDEPDQKINLDLERLGPLKFRQLHPKNRLN